MQKNQVFWTIISPITNTTLLGASVTQKSVSFAKQKHEQQEMSDHEEDVEADQETHRKVSKFDTKPHR